MLIPVRLRSHGLNRGPLLFNRRMQGNCSQGWTVVSMTFDISAYSHGLMGYETLNIDRIAREGLRLRGWR